MNRFEYIAARLKEDESFISKESQIKIYDGDQKVGQCIQQILPSVI